MQKGTVACLFVVVLAFTVAVHAKTASEVFDAVSSSIVVIRTFDANGKALGLGSGVILAKDLVATNYHVIEGAAKTQIIHKGKAYSASLRHSDQDRDVCTLTADGISAPAVVTGSTSRLKVGSRVYAIGAPKGLELTLSEGIVSSLRPVDGGQYVQITAPISPGSSGGGLFDEDGQLIGLPTFYLTEGQQLNFAVPVEWISELPKRHKKELDSPKIATTKWINKAVAFEGKKDWAALLAHSLLWTKAQPKDADAWFVLGVAYLQSGATTKAIETYQKVLRINPEYAAAYSDLESAYERSNQHEKAMDIWTQGRRIDPSPSRLMNKAIVFSYRLSGKVAKEIASLQEDLRINPKNARVWFNIGEVYRHTYKTSKAVHSYRQALSINPEYIQAWYGLIGTHLFSDDETTKYKEMINCYQQVLRLDPGNVESWYNLGWLYRTTGQTDKVMEVYKHLQTLDPARAQDFFNAYVLP